MITNSPGSRLWLNVGSVRTADLEILDLAAQWHEGPVWGSCAAATVILAKVGFGPFALLAPSQQRQLCKGRFLRKAADGQTQICFKARDG